MTTKVVNLARRESYDVYIGRAGMENVEDACEGSDGYFGNPFKGSSFGGGELGKRAAIHHFEIYFNARIKTDKEYRERVEGLRGKRLGCWCSPERCHGDVYVKYLEGK